MRNLTIIRKKSFVACTSKVYIYMKKRYDDTSICKPENLELLGTIKNGKELVVEIPNDKVSLVSAYNSLNTFYFCDSILIDEGYEDGTLYVKAKLNPAKGNPCLFEV